MLSVWVMLSPSKHGGTADAPSFDEAQDDSPFVLSKTINKMCGRQDQDSGGRNSSP
jgi:hypothetical protein